MAIVLKNKNDAPTRISNKCGNMCICLDTVLALRGQMDKFAIISHSACIHAFT